MAAFRILSAGELADAVEAAGLCRFRQLTDRLEAELQSEPPDQVAYRALMEGLGYASNRETFRDLADVVPFAWLATVPADLREDVLLDAARLGPPAVIAPPAHLPDDAWRLIRLRPANHPIHRLRGMAQLLNSLSPRLSDRLCRTVLEARKPSEVRKVLTVRHEGDGLIGAGRADELAVSAVLPLVSALVPESSAARDLYRRYPSPPYNRWTRHMSDLLSQAGHDLQPKQAVEHQGLHFQYHEHCRKERSSGCSVCGSTSRKSDCVSGLPSVQ